MPIFFFLLLPEAQIRFLKAKLRVMQEELDKLSQGTSQKVWTYVYTKEMY